MLNVMISNHMLNSEVIEMNSDMILANDSLMSEMNVASASDWRSHSISELPAIESAERCELLPHLPNSLLYSDLLSWKGRCTIT